MKTTDSKDPLDRQIDNLLASRPVKTDASFTERVISAAEAEANAKRRRRLLRPVLATALPLAAAVAVLLALRPQGNPTPSTTAADPLSAAEIHEILLLEDGLDALAQSNAYDFSGDELGATLDALTFEI